MSRVHESRGRCCICRELDHLAKGLADQCAAGIAAEDQTVLRKYQADLRELGKRPQVFVKISEVLRRVNGKVPLDLNFYRPRLDEFWDIFGQDRLIYGSDWPNSDLWAPYPQVLKLAREYITSKGPEATEKFFWKNSVRAYRWVKRDAGQPQASGI